MAEPVQGVRGTKYSGATEALIVRDVHKKILLLQPDDTPLLIFSTKGAKRKVEATAPKFEWVEDAFIPNVVAGAAADGTGTTINVATGTGVRVKVDDLLIAPNGESIHVTGVSTDALTVTRSMGSIAAYTVVSGTQFIIIPSGGVLEGADAPAFKFVPKETKHNFIQIFRDSVIITHTQDATENYGGNDREFQRMKKAMEHKRGIEQALLFGDKFEDTSGTQARRGTGGLFSFITTNVTDAAGVITEGEMETFLRTLFRYHPTVTAGSKLFIAAPILISAFNFWAKSALRITTDEKVYGVNVTKYRSGHGTLDIVRHWLLEDFDEFKQYGFGIDTENVWYRYLRGLDTKMHLNTGIKSKEEYLDEYRTHCGLQVAQEKTHGYIKGVTGYA